MFLDTNDDVTGFNGSDVDVALRFGVPSWGNLYHELVADEDLIVVAAPTLASGDDLPLAPSEIARLPLIHDLFNLAWGEWADHMGYPDRDLARGN